MGRIIRATYANQGISFYRLTPEKTTWQENYVDKWVALRLLKSSPEFHDSDVIKEKAVGTSRPLMPYEVSRFSNLCRVCYQNTPFACVAVNSENGKESIPAVILLTRLFPK